jgi:hypothetical protein
MSDEISGELEEDLGIGNVNHSVIQQKAFRFSDAIISDFRSKSATVIPALPEMEFRTIRAQRNPPRERFGDLIQPAAMGMYRENFLFTRSFFEIFG